MTICILTYPMKDGGYESRGTIDLDDGRQLVNIHRVNKFTSRDEIHNRQNRLLAMSAKWQAEHEAWLKDPSSLDRTEYNEGMKDFIRGASWLK